MAIVVGAIGCRIHGISIRGYMEAVAPGTAVGQAIGRVGCFLVGDDYGRVTTLPWGIAFPQGAPPTLDPDRRREGLVMPRGFSGVPEPLPVPPPVDQLLPPGGPSFVIRTFDGMTGEEGEFLALDTLGTGWVLLRLHLLHSDPGQELALVPGTIRNVFCPCPPSQLAAADSLGYPLIQGESLAALGDPQLEYPSVHVVGSNGKGTTARTVEETLARAGLLAGCYTSPHVTGWAERIRGLGVEDCYVYFKHEQTAPAFARTLLNLLGEP